MNSILDRKKSPLSKEIEHIDFIEPKQQSLGNKVPVYTISGGTQDVLMVRLIFKAGIWYQPSLLISYIANKLLAEGTKSFTADVIAERIDYFGAEIELEVGQDLSYITLYCLSKDSNSLMPILEEIVKYPTFPQHELNIFLQNSKQKYAVNLQKVKHVARINFGELLFGNQHPYGQKVNEADYDAITANALLDFHKHFYTSANCKVILAGRVNDDLISLIDKHFGGNDWNGIAPVMKAFDIITEPTKINYIERVDTVQSALLIGKVMFNKTHPDYTSLQVLNTVFGGYFGSRLMSNIREEKGFTYGIASYLISYINSGMFYITSEVGSENSKEALSEIYKELNTLKTELIPEDELDLVRNYMLGSLLRGMDGPFSIGERFRSVMEYGLDMTFYDKYVHTIKSITAEQLMALANKYFADDSLTELLVGKK